jgi:hypothetical protein
MAKTRLLQTVCALAMLAAAPAFAQRPEAGMTSPNGTPNPEANQPASQSSHSSMAPANTGASSMNSGASSANMAPADKMGSANNATNKTGSTAAADSHSTHRSAMAHPTGMMRSRKTDESQNAAIDNLNDQSYQSAQKGEAFAGRGADKASGDMAKPSGSGSMNDMSGGSMTGDGSGGTGNKP